MFISAPTISQYAALASFDCTAILDERKKTYQDNLTILKQGLPSAGFTNFIPADGAFYLYCNVENICDNSEGLCKDILDNAGVAITPGTDFDWVITLYYYYTIYICICIYECL